MNLTNITWEEAQHASRLEKSLITRTEELNQEHILMVGTNAHRDTEVTFLKNELA